METDHSKVENNLTVEDTAIRERRPTVQKTDFVLGMGSYGIVYKALFTKGDTTIPCAIKEMKVRSPEQSGFGNFNELEILVKLNRSIFFPEIYIVISAKYTNTPLENSDLKMEYLSIVTELAEKNGSKLFLSGKYTFSEAKKMCAQLLLGLDHMHKRGISHRDLKSSNLLLFRDEQGNILLKITDFGLSTMLPYRGERDGNVHTIWYRAPEIMHGVSNYKTTADIWCAGVIFFEIIVGPYMFKLVGSDPTVTEYLEFCINNIADDWTEELQSLYRSNSDIAPKIFGRTDIRTLRRKIRTYTTKFLRNNRFDEKPTFEELDEYSNMVMECLKFNYLSRPSASKLLKNSLFDNYRRYIDEAHKKQFSEEFYDTIKFNVPEEINSQKVLFFQSAIRKINFMSMRQFFYAVDLVNRFFTRFSDYSLDFNDVFAGILYFIHKFFVFISIPVQPHIFFFHKFPDKEITDSQFAELDIFIYNLEKIFLEREATTGDLVFFPIIRPCIYDMQNKYKDGIKPKEIHCLKSETVQLLFRKFCEIEKWESGRSYRYMYRMLYNAHVDSEFPVNV